MEQVDFIPEDKKKINLSTTTLVTSAAQIPLSEHSIPQLLHILSSGAKTQRQCSSLCLMHHLAGMKNVEKSFHVPT